MSHFEEFVIKVGVFNDVPIIIIDSVKNIYSKIVDVYELMILPRLKGC